MNRKCHVVGGALCLWLGACSGDPEEVEASGVPEAPPAADMVLLGGKVYTVDEARPWAEAVAIVGNDIAAVGSTADLKNMVGANTKVIDLAGRMVLPGFHDSHIHLVYGGLQMEQCSLFELTTAQAISDRLAECDKDKPGDDWLRAAGWELSVFPDGNAPKQLIDEVVPHRPVLVEGADGHSIWVNSRALEIADIGADTVPPPGGVIERDSATGEPSGTLREDANLLIYDQVPSPSQAARRSALARAQSEAHAVGITSVIEAAANRSDMETLVTFDRAGDLRLRVLTSLMYSGYWKDEPGYKLFDERESFRSELLKPDSAKIFVDGVLEGETAALLEPYQGDHPHHGELAIQLDALTQAVTLLDEQGIQVHMHAIGDAAVKVALDAVASAKSAAGGTLKGRHHIAHLQLIDPSDYPRFAKLGVTANFQALWAYPDEYITEINLPSVGQSRVDRMYPIGSLSSAGARIAAGSDWTVSSINPLEAIETALTRSDVDGVVDGALNAEEAVDLETMIAAYTANGAWLMSHDQQVGIITPGKRADLVVLERDLFAIPANEIGEVKVDYTLFNGQVVFER